MTGKFYKEYALKHLKKASLSTKRFGELFMTNMRKSSLQIEVITTDEFTVTKENATIFGATLKEILERSSFSTKGGLCIPYVLHRCFTEIAKKGIKSEGLFRLSGSAPKILQLEKLFSEAPDYGKNVDLTPYDVHTLAGTFKKLLRTLPEPIISLPTIIDRKTFAGPSASNERNLAILSSLGHRMNRHHFDLLKYIIAIAAYVEKEKTHNKMTAEALAIVLAPTCTGLDGIINKLPNSKEKERERDILGVSLGWNTFNRTTASKNVLPLNVVKDLEQWTALFQFMIINHEKLLVNWTSGFDYEETKNTISSVPDQNEPEKEEKLVNELKKSFEKLPSAQKIATTLRFDEFPELAFEDFDLPELNIAPIINRDYMRNSWTDDKVEILTRSKSASLAVSQSCEHFFAEPEEEEEVSTPIFNTQQRKTFKPAVNTEISSFSRSVQSARPYSPNQRAGDGKYFEILSQWKSREGYIAQEENEISQLQKQQRLDDDAIATEDSAEVRSSAAADFPIEQVLDNTSDVSSFVGLGSPVEQHDTDTADTVDIAAQTSAAVEDGSTEQQTSQFTDEIVEEQPEESSFAELQLLNEEQNAGNTSVASETSQVSASTEIDYPKEQPEESSFAELQLLNEEQNAGNTSVASETSQVSASTEIDYPKEQQEVLSSAELTSPHLVSLREEDDTKNKRKGTSFPDAHMNKIPSGQSLDSGVYSTDELSLSDL